MPDDTIRDEVTATLKKLEARDPGLKRFLQKAYAYAIFPAVGKAAAVVGGAFGRGAVFEKGRFAGYATLSQMTIGVQLGGDTFTEVVVFESKEAFERFKKGKTAFSANASAVLIKAGKAGTKDFEKGVAAFAYAKGGMLLELSIGGQRFKFKPADEEQEAGGKPKAGAAGKSKGRGGEADESEEGGGEEQDQEESTGVLSRATGGIRCAASRVGGLVKGHPVAATLIGVGLVGGALLATRALRGASAGQDEESEEEDEGRAEGRADSGAEDDEDESRGEEQERDEGSEEEEESGHDMLGFLRRRRTRA
jgi:hypothetical protein